MGWKRLNTRMPGELKDLVDRQSAHLGVSQAEYVRDAILLYSAWHQALDAVESGAAVEDLRDPVVAARFLGR